ncbi:UNVERIFIED_CONTAM: putative mitochondrial protein [Sesamum radiatum]|uniref:Mitochondrial protein n=1 Tax=Sesamum radiatum TaxID=300843 RepID=A0AAW2K609_SESRA
MFVVSCFQVPSSICREIEGLMADFLWHNKGMRKIHWLAWDKVCANNDAAGLGLKKMCDFSQPMLAKQLWRMITNPNSLINRIWKSRMAIYFVVLTTDIERGFNITTKCPQIERLTSGVRLRISLAAMKPTPKGRSGTFQVGDLEIGHRGSIEGPVETCTKYCSRVSSAGDVGRLCSFSGLVGKVVN